MKIIEVNSKADWKLFHKVPHRIYKDNPVWICPIEQEVQAVFTPAKNKAFLNGEAQCFVLLDNDNKPAGRIAAFIDHERNKKQNFPTGGLGYFECIDNQDFAYALFDRAVKYLQQWDVKAIDGPINFGEREKFWGLLINGHEFAPLHQENYQPVYYQKFFTTWGFRPFEQILTFRGPIKEVPIKRFTAIAERLKSRFNITAKSANLKRMDQMVEDFNIVYNSAFSKFEHFKPLTEEQTTKLFEDAKPIVDPKTCSFAYVDGNPGGFCFLLPEINPFLKSANGKMRWWNILQFLFNLKYSRNKSLKGIAFGIHQDYQKKGLFPVLVDKIYFNFSPDLAAYYKDFFLTTIRGHNTIMVDTVLKLGCNIDRLHIAYRKMLDETAPFEPFEFRELEGEMGRV